MSDTDKDLIHSEGLNALSDALQRTFALLRRLMLVLLLLYLASGIFIVKQHERAVVLRFGKLQGIGDERILSPGLHWTWPRPVSEIIRLPAGRVWSLTSKTHWHADVDPRAEHVASTLRPLVDGYALSGDANILHSEWAIRFTIDDLESYLFRIQTPPALVERELNRAVVLASAGMTIDDLLRTDLELYRQRVEQECRNRLSLLNTGIRVQGVDLLNVSPPRQVADAFDQVVRTEQEQAQEVTDARAYAARIINEARGRADQILSEGETAYARMLNDMKADADYFMEILPSVSRQPALMKQILWQDGIRQSLANIGHLYLVPSDETGRREIRLQLSPRRQSPFAEAVP
ncbi:MAG TPA: protease modulator HflK [Kiritimatiellia bacterium]|nr:protease modulator HflK [Kiritimatiellia bacterium]